MNQLFVVSKLRHVELCALNQLNGFGEPVQTSVRYDSIWLVPFIELSPFAAVCTFERVERSESVKARPRSCT